MKFKQENLSPQLKNYSKNNDYMCDQITLIKSTYTVNKNSGEIKLTQEDIKTLKGNCH